MQVTQDQIRNDPNYELVTEPPVPVIYHNKVTGNYVYLVGGKVMDRFCVLRDNGGVLSYGYRKGGIFRNIKNVAEAAAGLLMFGTAPRFRAVLDIFGMNSDQIAKTVQKVEGVLTKESVKVLINEFGTPQLIKVHKALKAALADDILTLEEWKEIEALAGAAM